jgi:hypothetical protein
MLPLMITWSFLGLVFLGIGLLLFRWISPGRPADWFLAFWLGWVAFLLLLQIENFVFPITAWIWIPLVFLAAPGWFFAIRQARASEGRFSWGVAIWILAALACGAYLALQSAQVTSVFETVDTGKYHLPAVIWSMQFPAVPGLGNFNQGLGSSSAYFLYAAMVNTGIWEGRPYYVVNGVLVWALVCQSLWHWRIWMISRGRRPSRFTLYSMLMLAPSFFFATALRFVSIAPDSGIYLLGLLLGGEWMRWLETAHDDPSYDTYAAGILLLASAGIAIKPTFFVYGGLSILLMLALWWKRAGLLAWRKAAAGLALCALIILPAMARTALFSGYLLYPTTAGALPVPWRVPDETVSGYASWIQLNTRTPGIPKDDKDLTSNWIPYWANHVAKYILALAAGSLVFGMALLLRLALPGKRGFAIHGLALPGILVASLAFWFFSAPDVRFAGSLFWVLAIVLAILAVDVWGAAGARGVRFLLPLAGILLCGWTLALGQDSMQIPVSLFSIPDAVPNPAFQTVTIGKDIQLHVPSPGNVCWNIPQPCSEDFRSTLRLIDPDDVGRGFYFSTQ